MLHLSYSASTKAQYVQSAWNMIYTYYAFNSLRETDKEGDKDLLSWARALSPSLFACDRFQVNTANNQLFLAVLAPVSLPKDIQQRERGWIKSPQQM